MKRFALIIGLLSLFVIGCSGRTSDLSEEKSPSAEKDASLSQSKNPGGHQTKIDMKTSKVGQGDEVRKVGGN